MKNVIRVVLTVVLLVGVAGPAVAGELRCTSEWQVGQLVTVCAPQMTPFDLVGPDWRQMERERQREQAEHGSWLEYQRQEDDRACRAGWIARCR